MSPVTVLQSVLFPPPPSIYVTAMSSVSFGYMAMFAFLEVKGKHLQYSKLIHVNNEKSLPKKQIKMPSKVGMLSMYAPTFLSGGASFFYFPDEGLRFLLLRLAVTIHYLKRVLEVLFIHRFGGSGVALDAALTISLSYFLSAATMIYVQHVSAGLPEPSIDLKYIGIAIFLIGLAGNFYHHYILSTLRGEGEKEYKIPKGGLFDSVVCPHYFFEVLGFVGVSCFSQTIYSLCYTGGAALYLMGRSYATRKWYLSKFEDFPKDKKMMIPFIF